MLFVEIDHRSLMSVVDQKPTLPGDQRMSPLPAKADVHIL
jgi:hypothetical protein